MTVKRITAQVKVLVEAGERTYGNVFDVPYDVLITALKAVPGDVGDTARIVAADVEATPMLREGA